MASAAFKYVPQPAATTYTLHSVLFLFYGFLVQGTTSSDDLCLTFCVILILWFPGSGYNQQRRPLPYILCYFYSMVSWFRLACAAGHPACDQRQFPGYAQEAGASHPASPAAHARQRAPQAREAQGGQLCSRGFIF